MIDIDHTLVDGGPLNSLRLFLGLAYDAVRPFPLAAQALTELQRDYQVVLMTARDDQFSQRTLDWLRTHDFPELPVVFSRRLLLTSGSRARYKTLALTELASRGLRLRIGVGDKPSDMLAYRNNGLQPVLFDIEDDAWQRLAQELRRPTSAPVSGRP